MGDVKNKKLTPKQERFCEEYIVDFDGTRAVKDAGYGTKYPGDFACQLLRKTQIKDYLKKLAEKDRKKRDGKKQRYLDEMEKLALSNITKYDICRMEEEGEKVKIKVTSEEGVDPVICATAAIKKIKQGKYGIELETHDKEGPLQFLIEREDRLDEILKDTDVEIVVDFTDD